MPRKSAFIRPRRGQTIFRVEWKKDQPTVVPYVVETFASSSLAVRTPAGKELVIMGVDALAPFGSSQEDALSRDFVRIATAVVKTGSDSKKALSSVGKLATLMK